MSTRSRVRPSLVYRAQAWCDNCRWKGGRHVVGSKDFAAGAAYDEANAHFQNNGHSVAVERWWRANCHRCKRQSPPFQRKWEALRWWKGHVRFDRFHLRLTAEDNG